MAGVLRLPAPNLTSTLPSFYKNQSLGTAKLVVPFTMNASVSAPEVRGFYVRIKTTTTDSLIAIHNTSMWAGDPQVVFDLPQDTVAKLVEGDYYKVQLAYYNTVDDSSNSHFVGYYSTAAIVKYTFEPSVSIQGLEVRKTNSTTARSFIGLYTNRDISEKVYQYRFTLYGITELVQTSQTDIVTDTGWLVHDSSTDTELGASSDKFVITEALESGKSYLLSYAVKTINGLQVSSATYTIVNISNIGAMLPFHINSELDYDNGRIKLAIQSNYWMDPILSSNAAELNAADQEANPLHWHFNGSYQLLRTDSKSEYKNWIVVYEFSSVDWFSNWSFYDNTVESGVGYKYGIEKINSNQIRSRRSETEKPVIAYFEDLFLSDGTKQLKVRFNTNVSSFKEVTSENKKTTLGRKYPVIMRNGVLKYKEFSFTGLLSYLSDPDELFMSKTDLLNPDLIRQAYLVDQTQPIAFEDSTDITDINVTAERNFCITALNWLNNGEIKMFRSSQEGCYLVKLTNVSLSPEATTGRMLHTFTATASEIADFSFDKLLEYKIITENDGSVIWTTETKWFRIHEVRDQLRDTYKSSYTGDNLSNKVAEELEKIDMTDGNPCIKIEISTPVGENQAQIMGTQFQWGEYEWAVGPTNYYKIELEQPYEKPLYLKNANGLSDAGVVKMTILKNISDTEDTAEVQQVVTLYGWSAYGADEVVSNNGYTPNVLREFVNCKNTVVKEYHMEIHSYPLIERSGISSWWNNSNNAASVRSYKLLYDKYVFYHDPNNNKYYRYNGSSLVEVPYNLLIKARDQSNPNFQTPLNIQVMQSGAALPEFDYNDENDIYLTLTNGVFTQIYYQVQQTTYTLESSNPNIRLAAKNVNDSYENWCAKAFNMESISSSNSNALHNASQLFIYKDGLFTHIDNDEYINYTAYNFYKPRTACYSASVIKNARDQYNTYLAELDRLLKLNL